MACAFLWMDKSKSDLALKVTVNDNQIFKNWSLENISGHTNSMNVSDFFFKLQLQKYKWAKGNLKFQRWSHLSSMTLSPSILPKKALRLFVMVASSLLVLGNKWSSPKLTVTVANLNCVHLYWIVFVFVIATGRSSTSHRSHGLCHWFH